MHTLKLDTEEDINDSDNSGSSTPSTTSDPVSSVGSNPNGTTSSLIKPDKETEERIRNLATVGTAIMQQTTSDSTYDTNFFLAIEALNKFIEGIHRLELDYESKKGMEDLVAYLHKKIGKRMQNANIQNEKPLV